MNYKSSSSALAIVMVASSVIPVSAATNEVIAGNDRFDTAARIADRMGNYNTAVLVNGSLHRKSVILFYHWILQNGWSREILLIN